MKIPHFLLLVWMSCFLSCAKDVPQRAEWLQNNVVAIHAGENGFGFITGQSAENLYVVTAEHVVGGAETVEVAFYGISQKMPAQVVYRDGTYDVAVLHIVGPPRFTWYKNCLGSGAIGDEVGFIGRVGTWEITRAKELGSIKGFPVNKVSCYLPNLEEGTSGAPLIHSSGIIGMILSGQSTSAEAIDMRTIQSLLKQERSDYFMLEPTGFSSGEMQTVPVAQPLTEELDALKAAQDQDNLEGYRQFIRQFPNGQYRSIAEKRIKELEEIQALKQEEKAWKDAKTANTIESYSAYLDTYPNGRYVDDIKERLERLQNPPSLVQNPPNEGSSSLDPPKKDPVITPKDPPKASLTDRDGNTYPTKTMADGHRWMTKNLNLKVNNSWCYKDDPSYCAKYGRLYTWEAAKEACDALGNGWRLPTDAEWRELGNAYGGYYDGPTTKDVGNPKSAYEALFGNGSSGFAAQLGGWRGPGGSFSDEGSGGNYWSSSPSGSSRAWYYDFDRDAGGLGRYSIDRGYGFSVRCRQGS